MVQLHGKSAGMVSPRGKALDPAHSDSQRLSLALFPALGTSEAAADGSGRSVNFTSCLLLNFHSFLHLGLPKPPTIHDRCSSLVGYLFCGSPEQRNNETRRPNHDENLILVARPKKKSFTHPSDKKTAWFRQKKNSAVLRAAMVSSRFLGYKIINEMERTRKFHARNLFEHFTAHNMYQCVKFTLICGDDLKQLVPFPQGKHCNT